MSQYIAKDDRGLWSCMTSGQAAMIITIYEVVDSILKIPETPISFGKGRRNTQLKMDTALCAVSIYRSLLEG